MTTFTEVTNAILLLGHKPDEAGNIQEGVRRRADLAARLYREGVAPVIIPSGWHWPKNPALAKFREAEIMQRYLHATHGRDINVICEPYSTSIPENLLFTRIMFPHLHTLTIVSGELFMERTKVLARVVFGDQVQLHYVPCQDGLSDEQTQQQLLANVLCIFKDVQPGNYSSLLAPPAPDGSLRSKWKQLGEIHYQTCPVHRRPQP
ncbi:MAG TPA: YdcF family protein [Candidatus Saccharimonadales bacterium]|nr:YdcF family protein [Candidatus Saccharimonadales bacterium]